MDTTITSSVSFKTPALSLTSLGFIFSLILAVFAPISTSVAQVSLYAVLLFFMLSGDWQRKLEFLRHPIVLTALAIFVWLFVGALYSEAGIAAGVRAALKYDKLLLVWCLMYFLAGNSRRQKMIFMAAATGILANLVAIYLNFLVLPTNWQIVFSCPFKPNPFLPAPHNPGLITFIFMILAFSSYVIAMHTLSLKKRYGLYALAALALIADVYLTDSRTGYLIGFMLMLFYALYYYRWKGLAYVAIAMALLFGGAYKVSKVFHDRVNSAVVNGYHFAAHTGTGNSSTELRLTFYKATINILREHPSRLLFGFGTGSAPVVSQAYFQEHPQTTEFKMQSFVNPHNQFLFFLLENGIVGLALLIAFIYFIFTRIDYQDRPWSWVIFTVAVTFVVGSMLNSWLHDFSVSVSFVTYIGILFSRYARKEGIGISHFQNLQS